MVKSMTAYGRSCGQTPSGAVTVEIKSVNGRYFDANVKLPRTHLALEEKIKSYLRDRVISRGKIDVFLTCVRNESGTEILPDIPLARQYVEALRTMAEACGVPDDLTASVLARNPDLLSARTEETDTDAEWEALLPILREAADAFDAMRAAEGQKTREDISAKMENFTAMAKEAEALSREDITGYRSKLEARLRQVLSDSKVTADENRILTECAIMADKLAVDEELARLASHRDSFYRILSEGGPCGKKLDFLLQEFNRETNTLGSKACDARIAALVVNMKNELEKIREQVQNIE